MCDSKGPEETSAHPRRGRSRARLRSAALAGMVLLGAGAGGSRAGEPPDGAIVALHRYQGTEVLAAYPRALYRIAPGSGGAVRVPLPPSVGRLAAVAADAAGRIYAAGPAAGVWVSPDGGTTWAARSAGLPERTVTYLTAHASQSETVYAHVRGDGIYRTEDAGRSWQLMDGGPEGMTGPFVHSDMPGSMQSGWLFAATRRGVSRAMDCFCLWRRAGGLEGEVYAVTYDPRRPEHVYAATERGLFRSRDGGEGWDAIAGPGVAVRALAVTPDGRLHAASDGGRIYASPDEGGTWKPALGS